MLMLAHRLICWKWQSITLDSLSLGVIHSLDLTPDIMKSLKMTGWIIGFLEDTVGSQWCSNEMMHFNCVLHHHGVAFRGKWMRPTMVPCGIAHVMFAEEEEKHLSEEANKVAWRGMNQSRAVAMVTAHCLSASTLNGVINGSEDIRSKKSKKKMPVIRRYNDVCLRKKGLII